MMNKKEQAAFDALRLELSIAKAMCFKDYAPEPINTELATKDLGSSVVVVAWCANMHDGGAREGCFSSVYHSIHSTTKTSTQGRGGPWYLTKREALMAVRMFKQMQYANALAVIDRQIEAEA